MIVIILFIGVALTLITLIVSETPSFFTTPVTGQSATVPGSQNPINLLSWNITNGVVLNNTNEGATADGLTFEIPSWTKTVWYLHNISGVQYIMVEKEDTWWIVTGFNREDFQWYDSANGTEVDVRINGHWQLPITTLDSYYLQNKTMRFLLRNSLGDMTVTVSFESGVYSKPSLSTVGSGLAFSINQDFADRKTTINILSVISGLFLGSLFGSNTLGLDPTISYIITLGLDIGLAYIVFQIIRSLIPLLPGGD